MESIFEVDLSKKFSDKIKLNYDILNKDYPEVKITEKNKEIVKYFSKSAEGSMRMQTGLFYTEEGWKKERERSLNVPLP